MKLNRIIAPVLAVFALTGCVIGDKVTMTQIGTKETTSTSNLGKNYFEYTCHYCSGKIIYSFKVKETDAERMVAQFKVLSGYLEVTLTDFNKNVIAQEKIDVDSENEYQFASPKEGTYKMTIIHTDFQGQYKCNWIAAQ